LEKKADRVILYEAYRKYQDLCKGKQMTAKQQSITRNDLFRRAERLLLFLNSPSTSAVEKNNLLRKCKPLYQQYSIFLKGNPGGVSESLAKKMDELLLQMTIWEEEQVHTFRKKEAGGEGLNMEAIFSEQANIRQLLTMRVENLLRMALKDKKFTIVSHTDQKIFITESGTKYHRADCPYCRGRKLIPASFAKIENVGYTPCKCIGATDKVLVKREELTQERKEALATQTMTAFIDESVRPNPWKLWDDSLPDRQSSYSYVICRGMLESEREITEENRVSAKACLANEAADVTMSAIEAISAVLLKIAFRYGFHGDVLIYTDNMAAKNKWYKNERALYLASLFESVKVCHIPREENTVADAVGRETAFADMPAALMGSLLERCRKYDSQKAELDFVKQFFPEPRQNIPNLINELRLIAGEEDGE